MQLFCVHFTIAHCSLCLTGQHEVLVRFSWSILSQYQMVPHYQYTQELSKVENTWNRKFEANASIIIFMRGTRGTEGLPYIALNVRKSGKAVYQVQRSDNGWVLTWRCIHTIQLYRTLYCDHFTDFSRLWFVSFYNVCPLN